MVVFVKVSSEPPLLSSWWPSQSSSTFNVGVAKQCPSSLPHQALAALDICTTAAAGCDCRPAAEMRRTLQRSRATSSSWPKNSAVFLLPLLCRHGHGGHLGLHLLREGHGGPLCVSTSHARVPSPKLESHVAITYPIPCVPTTLPKKSHIVS